MKKYILYVLAVYFLASSPAPSFAQDCERCKDILALGQRVIRLSSGSDESEDTKNWFCSDQFEERLSSGSFRGGITVPIEGVPISFQAGSDNSESFRRREQFCSDQTRQFRRSDTYSLFEQLADANVVREWGRCVERSCGGGANSSLLLRLERSGSGQVNVALQWRPRFTGDAPPVITSIRKANLDCSGGVLATGERVTIEGLVDVCTADRRQDTTLTINTTGGPVSKTLSRNLNGLRAGTAFLSGAMPVQVWRPNGEVFRDMHTGDHHCGGGIFGCRGEDRRTRYEIEIVVGADERLSNPRLNCLSGPCGGWFHIWHVVVNNDGHRAQAAFDVWSRPTVWRLTCNAEKLVSESRSFSSGYNLVYGREVTITVPRNNSRAEVQVRLNDGNRFTVRPGESRTGLFELVNTAASGDNNLFTYRVSLPND